MFSNFHLFVIKHLMYLTWLRRIVLFSYSRWTIITEKPIRVHIRHRTLFGLILGIFTRENFRTAVYHGGFDPMAHSEMLFITLQYLGNQGAIRLLADKFNRTESYRMGSNWFHLPIFKWSLVHCPSLRSGSHNLKFPSGANRYWLPWQPSLIRHGYQPSLENGDNNFLHFSNNNFYYFSKIFL